VVFWFLAGDQQFEDPFPCWGAIKSSQVSGSTHFSKKPLQ
jgi:hypothetical protein